MTTASVSWSTVSIWPTVLDTLMRHFTTRSEYLARAASSASSSCRNDSSWMSTTKTRFLHGPQVACITCHDPKRMQTCEQTRETRVFTQTSLTGQSIQHIQGAWGLL